MMAYAATPEGMEKGIVPADEYFQTLRKRLVGKLDPKAPQYNYQKANILKLMGYYHALSIRPGGLFYGPADTTQ